MSRPILRKPELRKIEGSSKGRKVKPYTGQVSPEQLKEAYRIMLTARLTDEKSIVLYKQNKCHFQISCAGHEAVQSATSFVLRPRHDWFYPYYRDMALCAGLGMTCREFMLNAINKEDDPNSHGRQMPMHYGHKELNIVNQSSPTGSQFLQAVGCALASRLKGLDEVTYVSAGEGACSQGDFHEALNWAARERLPVLFMIQNNEFAISVHVSEQLAGESVYLLTSGYSNLHRAVIDGTDLLASYEAVKEAAEYCRSGTGPSLIEAKVPRLQSHSISDNHLKYRTEVELRRDASRCPIIRMHRFLIENDLASEEELAEIKEEVKTEVDNAAEWAEAQHDALAKNVSKHIYVNSTPWVGIEEDEPEGEEVFFVDALNHALDEELAHNPHTYVFGEDVAHGKGGVFGITAGLTAKYGPERVFNSQLAESAIVGAAIGMATRGLRPIPEIQFGDYIWPGMNQIRNELAMLCYRSAGDFSAPVVIRVPVGGYIHGGSYHSQNIEATFAHFPGLFIVYPSNATDAKGLLKAAIRGKDPVLFLEHKGLYRQVYAKGREGGENSLTPIGKARIVQQGSHLTIVTWGALVQKSVLAARELEKEGVSVEIIDLRTIVPLDSETIFKSAKKTGKVLIAHEDVGFMGFGAEIAAQVSEECFSQLDAPVRRVAMKNVAAVSHAGSMESVTLPQNEDVLRAARELVRF